MVIAGEARRFYPSRIKKIIKDEVDRILGAEKTLEQKYSDEEAKRVATEISEQVRTAIKST